MREHVRSIWTFWTDSRPWPTGETRLGFVPLDKGTPRFLRQGSIRQCFLPVGFSKEFFMPPAAPRRMKIFPLNKGGGAKR